MAEPRDRTHLLALVLMACVAAACDEDKPKETRPLASEEDGGESQLKGVDPELAEAVAKAKKNENDPKQAKDENGPPESGVFEPGKADEQLKRGAAPKISLGDAGKEPRVSLVPTLAPGWKESGTIEIALKGRSALPEITFGLSIEALKAKEGASGQPMVAKIDKAGFTTDPGAQGKEIAAQLAKMRGSRIDFRVVEGGVGVDYGYVLAKGVDPTLEIMLRGVGEALETATLGFPKEAIGPGGYWLVTTRGMLNGAEVVSYRMVKLEKVEGSTLTLSVNTKRYATSNKLDVPNVPPGTELVQFQSTVEGTLTAEKNQPIAAGGATKQQFLAALIQPSNPQQPMAAQSATDTTFKFGKK